MNTFWSMSTNAGRKRSDGEEQGGPGEQRSSPAHPPFGKKQLPSIPKNAVPITKAASPASSTESANGTHASYGPFYLEYSLLAEFTLVIKQRLPGIYVQPSYRSTLMWFGVIFIRHGLYQDGVFKFTVYIPDNFPDGDCPRVIFDTPVFHPLVDSVSGELDVRRAFTKWRRNHNHIWQVLMYARTIFYKINTMDPLNPEAVVLVDRLKLLRRGTTNCCFRCHGVSLCFTQQDKSLYGKDFQLFKSKVVDSVKLCNSHLFDQPKIDDPFAISFSPWNPAVHEEAKDKMFAYKRLHSDPLLTAPHNQRWPEDYNKGPLVSGLSWVKPGSTQPFSKEDIPLQT